MNALEAAGQGMEILYSTRAWLLAGLALLGVELFIPNGYALALGIAAAMVGTMVWATGEYEWARADHTDPARAVAARGVGALQRRRIVGTAPDDEPETQREGTGHQYLLTPQLTHAPEQPP